MKWIGALLFIFMSTWIGFEWSSKLDRRPKQIRQFKDALKILEAEMLYSQMPLAEAFKSIAHQTPNPVRLFFKQIVTDLTTDPTDFLTVWDQNVKNLSHITSFENNEIEILQQFGRTLGQHDYLQQQKHIKLTITHLDRELEEARDNQRKYGKMAKSLGLLCGLFIVLLLI